MDADSGDLNRHSNSTSTLFSLPLQPTAHKALPLNPFIPVHQQQHQQLHHLQEMLETSTTLDHSHNGPFDNRATSMYYPPQSSSAYDGSSPESLRKASPVDFLRNVQPSKRLTDLQTRALPVTDAPGAFNSVKGDYYGTAEGFDVTPTAQFLRSPPTDYYPMETAFSISSSHPQQTASMTFPKEDESQEEVTGDIGRGYEYTSSHSNAQVGHPTPLMPQMHPEPAYAHLEENFGKISTPAHTVIQSQHPLSSTSSTNIDSNNGGKAVTNRLQSGNPGPTAIIYPWMKRVHSKDPPSTQVGLLGWNYEAHFKSGALIVSRVDSDISEIRTDAKILSHSDVTSSCLVPSPLVHSKAQ